MLPSIFRDSIFDDWMDDFPFFDDRDMKKMEKKLYGHRGRKLMKTDIREKKDAYVLEMDLPGFKKEEILVSLDNGYLTVSAAKGIDQDDKKNARYIRRERYAGACRRSFYVGDGITQEDIKGEFKHGMLKLTIPKKEVQKEVPENKYITIEG